MILLAAAEFEDSEVTAEALEELRSEFRAAGLAARVADDSEARPVRLRKSLDPGPVVDIVVVVLEDVYEELLGAAIAAVVTWARKRLAFRRRNGGRPVAVIWSADGRVLKEVELPTSDDG